MPGQCEEFTDRSASTLVQDASLDEELRCVNLTDSEAENPNASSSESSATNQSACNNVSGQAGNVGSFGNGLGDSPSEPSGLERQVATAGQAAKVKRPFCKECQKAAVVCICGSVPERKVPNSTKLIVLQHYKETKHPLGSVRFAKLGFENVSVVVVKELACGLPWMQPPFSRKERARARALARAQERSSESAGDNQQSLEGYAEAKADDQEGLESLVETSNGTSVLDSKGLPERKEVGTPLDARRLVSEADHLSQSASPSKAMFAGPKETSEKPSNSALTTNGDAASSPENSRGDCKRSETSNSQEIKWERSQSGRKVRSPTFEPPPEITITPRTAVLFPGPNSVDLLEAAEIWGLSIQSSPFSPSEAAVSATPQALQAVSKSPSLASTSLLAKTGPHAAKPPESKSLPNPEIEVGSVLQSPTTNGETSDQLKTAVGLSGEPTEHTPEVSEQLGAALQITSIARANSEPSKPAQNPPEKFPVEPPDQLILIDGTWSKATRVYHEHGWLHALPQYKLPLGKRTSRYKNMRKEPKKEYLSTLESGAWALQLLEPTLVEEIEGVLDSFEGMIRRQAEYQREAVRLGKCKKVTEGFEELD